MKWRNSALCRVLLLTILLLGCRQDEQPPNIVLILVDDQGWNGTSVLMDPRVSASKSDYYLTPSIARLAAEGMTFSNGYAPSPICVASRRSIQFGQTPARLGTRYENDDEPRDQRSIPEILKEIDERYATAHFGKWHMKPSPSNLGYDESDGSTVNRTGGYRLGKKKWLEYRATDDPKLMFEVTDRAIDFMIRKAAEGRPFYLQVSHYAVHMDMETRPETYDRFDSMAKGSVHRSVPFAGMTRDLDDAIGRLLESLEILGLKDETYVFYTSDNGAVFEFPPKTDELFAFAPKARRESRNHPLRGGKWTLFEGGIRVPFVVTGPGIEPGSTCSEPVVGWDLLPTFAALAGSTSGLPENLDGGDFASLLKNTGSGDVVRPAEALVFHSLRFAPPHSSIRVGDYKLIRIWRENRRLLYNLKEDIGESNDLAESMPGKAEELDAKLQGYLESVGAEIPDAG